jgi:hypothetical protein
MKALQAIGVQRCLSRAAQPVAAVCRGAFYRGVASSASFIRGRGGRESARSAGKPSSTDKGFNLDDFVTSDDDEHQKDSRPEEQRASASSSEGSPVTLAELPEDELEPRYPAIVDSDGDVFPLRSDDERALPFLGPGMFWWV